MRNLSHSIGVFSLSALFLLSNTSASPLSSPIRQLTRRQTDQNTDPNHYLHCQGYYSPNTTMTSFCSPTLTCDATNPGTKPSYPSTYSNDRALCINSCQCHVSGTPIAVAGTQAVLALLDCQGDAPAGSSPGQDINSYCAPVLYCLPDNPGDSTPFSINSINAACRSQCACNAYALLQGQARASPEAILPVPVTGRSSSSDGQTPPSEEVQPQQPTPCRYPETNGRCGDDPSG